MTRTISYGAPGGFTPRRMTPMGGGLNPDTVLAGVGSVTTSEASGEAASGEGGAGCEGGTGVGFGVLVD